MSRNVLWQKSPSDNVSWQQDQALNSTIYILRELGPTSFLLKENGIAKKFKVLLGNPHICDCSIYKREKTLCKHICWILLKKFKLDRYNELSYQNGLVEREIEDLLKNLSRSTFIQNSFNNENDRLPHSNKEKTTLSQRKLNDDDVCPICQEKFLTQHQPVTFCRYGCGNNVHIKCMKIWVDHLRQSVKKDMISCPLCRGDFADFKLLLQEYQNSVHESRVLTERYVKHIGFSCNMCQMNPIAGKCYKCVECPKYYLCNSCFHVKQHGDHQFVYRLKHVQQWKTVQKSFLKTASNLSLTELQSRDITENDYELLMQLDGSASETSHPVDLAGLPSHLINSLPVQKVRPGCRLLKPGKQCRLCLRPYLVSEFVRRLPHCRHIFHRSCIDEWLQNDHRRCPVDQTLVLSSSPSDKSSVPSSKEKNSEKDELDFILPGIAMMPNSCNSSSTSAKPIRFGSKIRGFSGINSKFYSGRSNSTTNNGIETDKTLTKPKLLSTAIMTKKLVPLKKKIEPKNCPDFSLLSLQGRSCVDQL